MSYLLIVLVALGIGVLHALIGGVKLVYSLPAYSILGLAGVVAAAVPWKQPTARGSTPCLITALLLAAYVVVRAVFSPVEYFARNDLFMVLGALLVYLIVLFHLPAQRHRAALIWIFLGFAVVDVVVGGIQFKEKANFMLMPWMFRPDYGYRASGLYVCPNHIAGSLEILAMLALSFTLWARVRPWVRIVGAYFVAMCLVGVAITGSRGGYLSTIAGLLSFGVATLFVIWKVRRRWFWPLVLAIVIGGGGLVMGAVSIMRNSADLDRRLGEVYDPTNMRLLMWQASLKAYHLNPVTGVGSGTYLYWGRHFRDRAVQLDPQHVHCDYLELLCEYGIVGVALFTLFFGTHLWAGFRSIKRIIRTRLRPSGELKSTELALLLGIAGALGALVCHSIVDFNLHIPANTVVVAFLFGILASPGEPPGRETRKPPLAWRRVFAPVLGVGLIALAVPDVESEYYTELARVRHRDQLYAEAIDFATKALRHDSANPNLYFYLGESKHSLAMLAKDPIEQGHLHNEAILAFNEGLKHFPQDLNLLLKLGRSLDNMGRYAEAERVFRFAMGADPSLGTVYAYYGNHYFRLRQLKRAQTLYRKALDLGEAEIAPLGMRDIAEYRRLAKDEDIGDQYPIEDEDGDEDWLPEPL